MTVDGAIPAKSLESELAKSKERNLEPIIKEILAARGDKDFLPKFNATLNDEENPILKGFSLVGVDENGGDLRFANSKGRFIDIDAGGNRKEIWGDEKRDREFLINKENGSALHTVRPGETVWGMTRDALQEKLGRVPTHLEIFAEVKGIADYNKNNGGAANIDRIKPGEKILFPPDLVKAIQTARGDTPPADQSKPNKPTENDDKPPVLPENTDQPTVQNNENKPNQLIQNNEQAAVPRKADQPVPSASFNERLLPPGTMNSKLLGDTVRKYWSEMGDADAEPNAKHVSMTQMREFLEKKGDSLTPDEKLVLRAAYNKMNCLEHYSNDDYGFESGMTLADVAAYEKDEKEYEEDMAMFNYIETNRSKMPNEFSIAAVETYTANKVKEGKLTAEDEKAFKGLERWKMRLRFLDDQEARFQEKYDTNLRHKYKRGE